MSGSLNKVFLIGNLGADPEVRQFENGGSVCNFNLATSDKWKDKNTGERREKTYWHRVTVLSDGLVKICEKYLKKGSKICIEGRLETRKWQDQDGKDRYSTEVVLRPYNSSLQMLDGKNGRNGGTGESAPAENGDDIGPGYEMDDDIPF